MDDEWYDSLTQEEKDSLEVKLCLNCFHTFTNNPDKLICLHCEAFAEDTVHDLYI